MARRKRGRDLHGILLFDKPAGGSSNQVLQRVRRLFDANKAGHTGSLDPLATGMLPICFGEATKLSQTPVPQELTLSKLQTICKSFLGDQMQVPPMVSAIKVNGQRLYKLARKGIEIDRKPRAVTFHKICVRSFNDNQVQLAVTCSKGTYIRSLVSDIGDMVGCGAHVLQLRRTFVAPFEGLVMWSEEQLNEHENPDSLLMPVDAGLDHLPMRVLDEAGKEAFFHGQSVMPVASSAEINPSDQALGGICRIYGPTNRLLGLGAFAEQGRIAPKRVLQMG